MKITDIKKILSFILCIVLITAIALFTIGCNDKDTSSDQPPKVEASNVLGKGKTQFFFTVIDKNGKETSYEINTDKKTVGDALVDLELIDGEQGDYGLYVKTVDGITLSDNDRLFWALYMNGKQLQEGVSSTEITKGATYSFKAEKY